MVTRFLDLLTQFLKPACARVSFPRNGKKQILFQVIKKMIKMIVKNYHPVTLLPICGKIFERLPYNEMINFYLEIDLISPK